MAVLDLNRNLKQKEIKKTFLKNSLVRGVCYYVTKHYLTNRKKCLLAVITWQ